MKDEIDAEDYKIIKTECNETLRKLEANLTDLPSRSDSLKSIENLIDIVLDQYSDIIGYYTKNGIEEQRRLIGSMYPKNICFDGTQHRTTYLNEPLDLILMINSELHGIKKGESLSFKKLSPIVAGRGIAPPPTRVKINKLQNGVLADSPSGAKDLY